MFILYILYIELAYRMHEIIFQFGFFTEGYNCGLFLIANCQ